MGKYSKLCPEKKILRELGRKQWPKMPENPSKTSSAGSAVDSELACRGR
jgi:hypothetical protein